MKSRTSLPIGLVLFALCPGPSLFAAELVHAKDGSGVYGYNDTPLLPWCGYRVHDADRPNPRRVDPGPASDEPAPVPADAVILFDGKDLSQWEPSKYKLVDSCIEAGPGNLTSKAQFGDCQIHLEWMAPAHFQGPWYNQGNNGVMLMGLYEIQIFDSWTEKIYPDGMAAAIYGQTPPLVNAARPPGQWQTFDIVFTAPVVENDKLVRPARVTMFHNGILVHLNDEIHGETGHRILPEYRHKISQGPISLYGHDCPVRFRNFWVRPL
jgi:hypothetical protein